MSLVSAHPENCGCCRGVTARTPVVLANRSGLSAVAYRVGTFDSFKRSMLAKLSALQLPALAGLRTRKDDDFSIALLDAWAVVADVLSFYQERLVNEAFLRTATERLSILQLARLIGYQLSPGVAASAYLAFTLEEAEGSPEEITLEEGVRVQSTPGPDEKPQTFETVEEIEARPAWNAMKVQTVRRQALVAGLKKLYLQGVDTRLGAGDALLIVGDDRVQDTGSQRWRFRILSEVLHHSDPLDPDGSYTIVAWEDDLGNSNLPQTDVRVYALRQRAALFGHNAPNPLMLNPTRNTDIASLLQNSNTEWKDFHIKNNVVDLDAVYKRIVAGGWFVLAKPSTVHLYRADNVLSATRTDYALSGKVTRLVPDHTASLAAFDLPSTTAYAESDELTMADLPLKEPLYGNTLAIDALVEGLQPEQKLAVSGRRQRLQLIETAPVLTLEAITGTRSVALSPGDELRVMAPPVKIVGGDAETLEPSELVSALDAAVATTIRWELMDRDGFVGRLTAGSNLVRLLPALEEDEIVSEIVAIKSETGAVSDGRDRTTLTLGESLEQVYDPISVRINGNVALATHGETVTPEVLGSGDAGRAHQRFSLRQTPLTHVSAANAAGRASTLELRVNDVLWKEVPSLYGRGPNERVYKLKLEEGGKTTVQFGDGSIGARLPTGQNNVRATYRKGIGLEGLVAARQLDQLMSRPLGLKEAVNPLPSEGASAPESLVGARKNAPLTVLTLDRVVSLQDYEDFARAYAGIAKADAAWVWRGAEKLILITVAGPKGTAIRSDGVLHRNLVGALKKAGDPRVGFRVLSYRPAGFKLSGTLVHHPDYLPDKVLASVRAVLKTTFSFKERNFGQAVALGEVIDVIHSAPGVVAVDLDELYRSDGIPEREHYLSAQASGVSAAGDFQAAELLTLEVSSLIDLEVSQ